MAAHARLFPRGTPLQRSLPEVTERVGSLRSKRPWLRCGAASGLPRHDSLPVLSPIIRRGRKRAETKIVGSGIVMLSMGESGAEDKPKRGPWERRNLKWKSEFEYFDYTGRILLYLRGVV